jgi:esterase/lipase superfamily enzyme
MFSRFGVARVGAMLRRRSRGGRRDALGVIIFALAVAVAGCASRPGPEVLTPVAAAAGSKPLSIYVATNRKRAAPSENVFTAERADTLNFAEFVVALPPEHRHGHIEWPEGTPDSRVSFATINQAVLTETGFRDVVAPPQKVSPRGKRQNLLIFVHGFNNNFQESLYRLAQIYGDSEFNGVPILFAWPSQAKVAAYAVDAATASHSRDDLIALLTMVTSSPQVGEIMIVAHSMGGMLVTDALSALRIGHRDRVIARLGRIVLAAPDIDAQAFRSQVQTIGPLKPPLTVLVAKDDTALKLSGVIGGSNVRAGALDIENPLVRDAALKAKVRIVDISELSSSDGMLRHDRFVNLAAMYPRLQSVPEAERQTSGTFLLDVANAKPVQVTEPRPAN